eukprot:10253885-Lingulodinium_polyedra.AAC.1
MPQRTFPRARRPKPPPPGAEADAWEDHGRPPPRTCRKNRLARAGIVEQLQRPYSPALLVPVCLVPKVPQFL